MTVRELAERLAQLDPTLPVYKTTSDGIFPVRLPELVILYRWNESQDVHEVIFPEIPAEEDETRITAAVL